MLMATHDPVALEYASLVFNLADGRIVVGGGAAR